MHSKLPFLHKFAIRLRSLTPFLLMILGLLLFWHEAAAGNTGFRVVVLSSEDTSVEDQAVTGVTAFFAQQNISLKLDRYSIQNDPAQASETVQTIKRNTVDMILALGAKALRIACREFPEKPILSCMTYDSIQCEGTKNSSGVILEFPFEIQFQWLRKFLPDTKVVGVLYNSDENWVKIQAAQQVARKYGLEIYPQKVETPNDLPGALKNITRRVDALWGIVDPGVLNSKTAREVLLNCFRNKIPFIGPSRVWVKAGALYALDWDYADMGSQCGAMALKILNGQKPGEIPVEPPRKTQYFVNLKTAQHMRLNLPNGLIEGAAGAF